MRATCRPMSSPSWLAPSTAALFLLIAALVSLDLAADRGSGATFVHLLVEGGIVLGSVAGAAVFFRQWGGERREASAALAAALHRAEDWQAEASRWRGEAEQLLRGLGAAIEDQFRRWELTSAEADVALLLLKGLSVKEIADLRSVSERTVAQQARVVYRKAGLAGRAELAAFFLEDLLLPPGQNGPA